MGGFRLTQLALTDLRSIGRYTQTTWGREQRDRYLGELAGLAVAVHPHMLRHACSFALADQGADTRLIQDYLCHRNIQHTVRYTASNPARFERLWR
jgi:type 1 fimbriae regulatory protein FimB